MKLMAKIFLFITLFTCLFYVGKAQRKANAIKKSNSVETPVQPEDIPPPMEKISDDVIIDTSIMQDIPINFDTTAVVNDDFSADIRKMMNALRFKQNFIETIEQSIDQNISQIPQIYRERFKTKFMQELKSPTVMLWLENLFIKSYRQHFSQAEIKELTQFYQTDVGRKMVAVTPALTSGIMMEAGKIGAYVGQKAGKELISEK